MPEGHKSWCPLRKAQASGPSPAQSLILGAAFVALINVVGPGCADKNSPPPPVVPREMQLVERGYLYGKVRSASKTELILDDTDSGDGQRIVLSQRTKCVNLYGLNGHERASAQWIKPGTEVFVKAKRPNERGERIAKEVDIWDAPDSVKSRGKLRKSSSRDSQQ